MPEPTYRIAQALHARRAAVGLKKYGQHLSAASPGCMLVHALEEAADLTEYLLAEAQRRREAIRILLDTAERLVQWDDVNLNEDARQLVRVIDLLGGEAALAKYDEILGGAEDATVAPAPRDEALRVATEALGQISGLSGAASFLPPHEPTAWRAIDIARTALATIRGGRDE